MLVYRLLDAADANDIIAHLLRLEKDGRYSRFHGSASDEGIRDYVESLDWGLREAVGAFDEGVLVGVGEIAYEHHDSSPQVAEIAVSVDKTQRGTGVGRELVLRASQRAGQRGAIQSVLHFLQSNQSIPRIVRRLGGHVDLIEGEAVLDGFVAMPIPVEPTAPEDLAAADLADLEIAASRAADPARLPPASAPAAVWTHAA